MVEEEMGVVMVVVVVVVVVMLVESGWCLEMGLVRLR